MSFPIREQSVSIVSDMGQEMHYRYQEHLMTEFLDALRCFRVHVDTQMAEKDRRAAS